MDTIQTEQPVQKSEKTSPILLFTIAILLLAVGVVGGLVISKVVEKDETNTIQTTTQTTQEQTTNQSTMTQPEQNNQEQQDNQPTPNEDGPPQEALAACEGKSEGATCSFTPMQGQQLTGTCRNVPDAEELACVVE